MSQKQRTSGRWLRIFLNWVERVGNLLPHPATLFLSFALITVVISGLGAWLNWQAEHPATGETIEVMNLMTVEGLHMIIEYMVVNFTDFAPLGIVLVAMLGIGIAEQSGLIGTLIRLLVLSAPKRFLTFILVFAGILSNLASDIGYVLLIPLAGIIFMAIGRHPIAGMAAAFAGVSGGFSANLLLGTVDPLLAGLSQEAARILDPEYTVNPTANYYFMAISTFFISLGGTWVTEKIVVPRLGEYKGEKKAVEIERLSPLEKKGLKRVLIMTGIILAVTLAGMIPENGYFRGPNGEILDSPLIHGIVSLLFVGAALTGLVYGAAVGKFKNDADLMNGMGESMKTLSTYIVLVFFAAQFVSYFKWSNLGIIFAVKGAAFLSQLGIGLIPLMLLFIVLAASINMLMGSASAKWALMAPIFIPMFMQLGYSPELTQAVYRIGDSVTNIISPMMSFFALIIAYVQQYDKEAGIGTLIATMLPYSIAFFILWSILLAVWLSLGIPLGPGAGINYLGG